MGLFTSMTAKSSEQTLKKSLTIEKVKRMYGRPSSFIDRLPWVEAQQDSNTILLDDGRSVGTVFEVTPVATEGRSEEWLKQVRDRIADTIADVFPEDERSPWILQTYAYDDDQVSEFISALRAYPEAHAQGTQFTQSWLDTMEHHLEGISKEGGLFYDQQVTDGPWGGKMRRIKLCLYRRLDKKWRSEQGMTPEEEINVISDKLEAQMRDAGVRIRRCHAREFYTWMLAWFNPKPSMTNGHRKSFYQLASFPQSDELPWGDDFAESMFFELPQSNAETNTWFFDGLHHQVIRVNKLRRAPKIGALTGEVKGTGDKALCLMDKLPPGTVLATTTVITPQSDVEAKIDRIAAKSKGESSEATYARLDCETAKGLMAHKHKIYQSSMAVYIRAGDVKGLRDAYNAVRAQLLAAQLSPYDSLSDPVGLDAYTLNLPMVYEPSMDRHFKMLRPCWNSHLASLSGLLGRNRGTDHIGCLMYNRGGEMLPFDPWSDDRKKNAHGIILGPTGSGKSALITYWSSQIMAMHRPRMIIVEAGNSFGLLADYFASQGLSVNKVSIKPGSGISLAPFQDVQKLLLAQAQGHSEITNISEVDVKRWIAHVLTEEGCHTPYADLEEDERERVRNKATLAAMAESTIDDEPRLDEELDDDGRDILGEAEIICKLMITGGEAQELNRLRRSDRRLIRDAILLGGRLALEAERSTRVEDVADGFMSIYHDSTLPAETRDKAYEMGQALRLFTDGFEGEVFNGEAEPWPDVDVTVLDLATFARDGYQAQLAIAYTSIMQNANNLAERFQHSGRQLVMLTDEAHLITTNPLLSGFVVKVVKMWRKLGAWWWAATQNVADFPNEAEKMLNMVEWWVALVMPPEEVEQIARFRQLTPGQKSLMLSATKEPRKYTEGVVLSDGVEALFRNVPPSLFLSLAGTESSEKTERAEIMREFGISEVEAAEFIARQIDYARGIGPQPEKPISRIQKSA